MNIIQVPSRKSKLIVGYALLFIINGCFFTWSVLSLAFTKAFPEWTADQMALNGALNIAASAIASLLVPLILRKISTGIAARLSGVLFGIGWFCMLSLQWHSSITLLYIGYALAGYANGHLYSIIGQVLNASYPERTGAVSGRLLLVTGIGSLFMGYTEQILLDHIGLFGICLLFSVGFFALIMVCSHWMIMPAEWPSPASDLSPAENITPDVPIRQAVKMPKFWLFFGWAVFLSSGGLLAINNAANIFAYYQAPAATGMIVMLCTGVGCQTMGVAIDRFGLRISMLTASIFSLLVCTLMLAGHFSGKTAAILIGILLCGIGYGTTTSAKMAGSIRLFGGRNLTTFFGIFNLSIIPAAFIGPYISGKLQMLNQGYLPSFILMAILAGSSLLVTVIGWRGFAADSP